MGNLDIVRSSLSVTVGYLQIRETVDPDGGKPATDRIRYYNGKFKHTSKSSIWFGKKSNKQDTFLGLFLHYCNKTPFIS